MNKRYRIRFVPINSALGFNSPTYTKEQIEEYKRLYLDADLRNYKRIEIYEETFTKIESYANKGGYYGF